MKLENGGAWHGDVPRPAGRAEAEKTTNKGSAIRINDLGPNPIGPLVPCMTVPTVMDQVADAPYNIVNRIYHRPSAAGTRPTAG